MKKILYISLILHITAAIFSTGFHHFDEHFQILEFLNYKLGKTQANELPWEFPSMMRSWFQVYIYLFVHKTSSLLGVTSPFLHSFIFRLFSSLLGLYSLYSLVPFIKSKIQNQNLQNLTFALLNFSWFVPYIQTRPSAEGLGSSLFLLGFAYFIKNNSLKSSFISGLFLGAAYLCKYQIALMVMFLWFWAIVYKKKDFKGLSLSALSIGLMIIIGIATDYIGYGKFSFGPWNMLYENLILGKMKHFGSDPWWYFFTKSIKSGIAPIALTFIATTIIGIFRYPKSPLTWIFVPFFLFHSIISHKELRFIFPIILLSPLFLGLLINEHKEKLLTLYKKTYINFIVKFIVGLNLLVLFVSILKPANPAIPFYRYIYNSPSITEIKTRVENPFTMVGLNLNFYKKSGFTVISVKNIDDYKKPLSDSYIFFNKGKYIFEMEEETACTPVYMTYPKWVLKYNIGNWISRSRIWSLYYCN